MGNIFKKLLDYARLSDDYEDDYEDDYQEQEPKKRNRKSQAAIDEEAASNSIQSFKKERPIKAERSSNKVVPMRVTSKGLEVCIMKPTSFEESQEIGDLLLSGKATVINLEGFDDKIAQRIMDFVSGCVYAINGKLHRISNSIFIVSPDNIDISGDLLEFTNQSGFEPPIFDNIY